MIGMLAEFEVNRQLVFGGAVTGITYGLLAVGLILIWRSTKVVNVAHGELGAFGAALAAMLMIKWEVNYWVALAAALAAGAILGALVEATVVRRLYKAPRVILFVATLGASQMLALFRIALPDLNSNASYPRPLKSSWKIAGVMVQGQHLLILIVVPLLTLALALFLEKSKRGVAVRASAENPDAARLSSINVKAMSTLVWTLAGVLATVTVVLVAPLKGGTAVDAGSLGPSLLLRALAVALMGRMLSMPIAVLGGIVVGIVEAVLYFNYFDQTGLIDAVLFVVVLVMVLLIVRRERGGDRSQSMSFSPRTRPIPPQLQDLWWVRRLPAMMTTLMLGLAIAVPFLITAPSRHYLYASMLIMAIVAMSLTLLTGWSGQLSLGQFTFVGLGALLTAAFMRGFRLEWFGYQLELSAMPFELALLSAEVLCVVVALIVGAPALRVRGLFLAVTTLAFAVMGTSWLFDRPFLIGDSTVAGIKRAEWFGGAISLKEQRTYYFLCLLVLCLIALVLSRVRRSGVGRSLIAVRDNEQNAAAFTVSPARMKLMAFGLSGGIAGLAGGLFGGLLIQFGTDAFPASESLRMVAIATIGGLSSLWGAVLGALWVVGLPALFSDAEEVRLLTTGAGLLLLLMYLPGGLIQIAYSVRDAIFSAVANRRPMPEVAKVASAIPASVVRDEARGGESDEPALVLGGVSVRFGTNMAVYNVDLTVGAGEVVGLIGTNGAGKSTLMNAVGGFVNSTGRIQLFGKEVANMSPERRARLGLGRTFQQADLFPDLTVSETVQVALEARHRAHLMSTVIALPSARRAERSKRAEADELIAFFGLGRYANSFINELSTGTRRIVELACLIGLEAKLLCLDEPTAGVAQRETEAFAPLILRIREELGASLLVIEHDMPFIMGISDRVYCLEIGSVIAEGTPDQVRNDPAVIASYLGTDERAIERSDTMRKG